MDSECHLILRVQFVTAVQHVAFLTSVQMLCHPCRVKTASSCQKSFSLTVTETCARNLALGIL